MTVLTGSDLVSRVGTILATGGVIGLVSPYLSDFKYWGDLRGSRRARKFFTELLLSATLENDGRVFLITDPESLEREYSRDLLQEIIRREECFWVYLFTVPSLHAKLLFRNDQAVLGSANFTQSAFARNLELGYHVTSEPDLVQLKAFLNSLVVQGDARNQSAKALKQKLAAAGVWRQENLFDVVRLIAYAHYLLRTTRIHCIWHSLEEPRALDEFKRFLNSLESDYEDAGPSLCEVYSPIADRTDEYAGYYAEEVSIAVRKMKDVRKLFERVLSRDLEGAFDYGDYLPEYENRLRAPPVTKIRMTEEWQAQIVAALVEARIEDDGETGSD